MRNIPDCIWLQVGLDAPEDGDFAQWRRDADVMWCEDHIYPNDIEFVRPDYGPPVPDANKARELIIESIGYSLAPDDQIIVMDWLETLPEETDHAAET